MSPSNLTFDWDPRKDRWNLRDHKISFDTAKLVFDDPNHFTKFDRARDGEDRWHTIGSIGAVPVLIVHTFRKVNGEDVIRIISARKATKHEQSLYRKGTR